MPSKKLLLAVRKQSEQIHFAFWNLSTCSAFPNTLKIVFSPLPSPRHFFYLLISAPRTEIDDCVDARLEMLSRGHFSGCITGTIVHPSAVLGILQGLVAPVIVITFEMFLS